MNKLLPATLIVFILSCAGKCSEIHWNSNASKSERIKLCEFAEKQGDQSAPYMLTYLGNCYKNGVGKERDLKKAEALFRQAAKQGYDLAAVELQEMLLSTNSNASVIENAFRKLNKLLDNGVSSAGIVIAKYTFLNIVGSNKNRTLSYLKKSAALGDKFAYISLYCDAKTGFISGNVDEILADEIATKLEQVLLERTGNPGAGVAYLESMSCSIVNDYYKEQDNQSYFPKTGAENQKLKTNM